MNKPKTKIDVFISHLIGMLWMLVIFNVLMMVYDSSLYNFNYKVLVGIGAAFAIYLSFLDYKSAD